MKQSNILDISIYHIQQFLVLAEEGNFSKAADILHVAQPTLSIRISSLEKIIGTELFVRGKRPIELTEAGKYLYPKWKRLAESFEEDVTHAIKLDEHNTNILKVCSLDSSRKIPAIYNTALKLEQKCNIKVYEDYATFEGWKNELLSDDIDLVVVPYEEHKYLTRDFEYEYVYQRPLLVCMLKSNLLGRKKSISFKDLKDQKFIVISPRKSPSHIKLIKENCNKYGYEPTISRYVNHLHSLTNSIRENDEVAVICDSFFRDIETPEITSFDITDTTSGLIAVWKKGNLNKNIKEFIEIFKDEFMQCPVK